MKKLLLILLLSFLSLNSFAKGFYVSANASASGNGSFANPWQLQKAFNHPAELKPGDTVWIRGGIYLGVDTSGSESWAFMCRTKGAPGAPIIFRNYKNERVTIDGRKAYYYINLKEDSTYHTWFWGLEVTSSSTSRYSKGTINSHAGDMKFINMILHEGSDGIDLWNGSGGSELYGCLIYNNGYDVSGYGHGHGIYTQNENDKKISIHNNMFFNTYAYGFKPWSTNNDIHNYDIQYNILFNGGACSDNYYPSSNTEGYNRTHNLFITPNHILTVSSVVSGTGGKARYIVSSNSFDVGDIVRGNFTGVSSIYNVLQTVTAVDPFRKYFETDVNFVSGATASGYVQQPARNLVIKHNYTYSGNNVVRPPVNNIGDNAGTLDMILDSNVLTGQLRLNAALMSGKYSVKGNKIIAGIPAKYGNYLWGFLETTFPENSYYPNVPKTGLDYYITPNKYESGRAHVAIYNWGGLSSVQINISGIGLKQGDEYELINATDYYNDIISGVYPINGIITVPMINHTFAPIVGADKKQVSQFPKFGAFVIRKSISNAVPSGLKAINVEKTSADATWYSVVYATSYTLKYRVVGSSNWLSKNATGTTHNFTNLTPNTEYELQVSSVKSGITSSYSSSVFFTTGGSEYCTSFSNRSEYVWLKDVSVNGVNNSSGAAKYTDFTSKTFNVTVGDSVKLVLSPAIFDNKSVYLLRWIIWIDLNGDKDFNDEEEEVFSSSGSTIFNSTFSFLMPKATAASTRMRVGLSYNSGSSGGYPKSCGTYEDGETEDYTLKIDKVVTGISAKKNRAKVLVHPNPFSTSCKFTLSNTESEKKSVYIYNLLGTLVCTSPFINGQAEILKDNLSSGLYIYLVRDEQGNNIANGKLIAN
jgi:hypothetical protein